MDKNDAQDAVLALNVLQLLDGLNFQRALEVLNQARLMLNETHLVDTKNQLFAAKQQEWLLFEKQFD